MLFELRILLFCSNASPALRVLDTPGCSVCAVASHKAQLFSLLVETQPHVVLFYDLPEQPRDIALRISSLCIHTPPRLVCPAPGFPEADAVFDLTDPSSLLPALQKAISYPVSQLAAASMPQRLTLANTLLTELGMPEQLLGRESVVLSAAWLSALPSPIPPLKHYLYPLLAQAQGVSLSAVERRIRSAVENTWLNGSLAAQSRLFGFTVSAERGKPTNAEFLFLMAEHIRRRL